MACIYCQICDRLIDLDWDVDHEADCAWEAAGWPEEESEEQMTDAPPKALIEQIADRLSRPIPKPAQPQARTQQSWRTLRLDQRLRLRQRFFIPGMDLPAGAELTISKVDSLGISLTSDSKEGILRWTNPEWEGMFERMKKGRKTCPRNWRVR